VNERQTIFVSRNTDDPFARVPKKILDDPDLTWKAKGVLGYLLGKPSGWKVRVKDIANRGKDGVDAIRSALDELRTSGYADLDRVTDETGKIIEWFWKIADEPIYLPDAGNPDLAKPQVEKPDISKNDQSENDISSPRRKVGQRISSAPEAVEAIYALYPRKVGKPAALKAIARALGKSTPTKLREATEAFAELWEGVPASRMIFVPHPATWFSESRFDDDPATWRGPDKEDRPEDTSSGWSLDKFKADQRKEVVNAS
jgi:hypothetical protein